MKKIIVYSKPNCYQCEGVKKYLDDKNVEYESINVFEDDEALTMLRDEGYAQMPVVVIEGMEPHTGFRPDLLAEIAVEHSKSSEVSNESV